MCATMTSSGEMVLYVAPLTFLVPQTSLSIKEGNWLGLISRLNESFLLEVCKMVEQDFTTEI